VPHSVAERLRCLVAAVLLVACTNAEEKARERESAMIEQAKADSAAEADFIGDSVRIAASIVLDTIRDLRVREISDVDDDGETFQTTVHEAVAASGQVCALTTEKYLATVRGDTLTCQWGPPP
jgi:hypothetical protein